MENIRRSDVDTQDEVANVINQCINNMNGIEARQLEGISRNPSVDEYNAAIVKYNESIGFKT
jgi:hypothetical protein